MKVVLNFLLAIIAWLLLIILEPISFIYVNFIKKKFHWSRVESYFLVLAIAIDRFGNVQYRSLFNKVLITDNGYKFGDFRETISSVLGKNQRDGTLTKWGHTLANFLDWLDKNHCQKSIVEL